MIAFATLILGLVTGPQPIELIAGDAVAGVELVLDGETVARLERPPWRTVVDLGPELAPHELVAIARDAAGAELGRVRQWLNLPQPPADARVLLEAGEDGGPTVARLAWQSLAGADPQEVRVSFDGRPLEVTDPTRFELPPHDPRALHFLRAELIFSENVSSVAEVTFGGTYAVEINLDITAVPIRGERRSMTPAALRGALRKDGAPLEVVAVEQGPALAVLVIGRGALDALESMAARILRKKGVTRTISPRQELTAMASLKGRQSARFLWPVTRRQRTVGGVYDLFPTSEDFPAGDRGLLFLTSVVRRPPHLERGPQRLADAVANAGLEAAGRRRARAVVLLLGEQPEDESVFTPSRVRAFLERLRVPLHVWSTDRRTAVEAAAVWGEVRDVSATTKLARAAKLLAQDLATQHIVWVDGIHRPQDVELASGVEGVRLVR